MADSDPFDVLAGMDAPRPLPAELRAELEEQLLGQSARPLDAGLDARLAERMTDPVARMLADLDTARPLTATQRNRLSTALVRRRRAPWLAGAAAAVLMVAGLALVATRDHPASPAAGGATVAHASPSSTTQAGGVNDTTGGGMALTPVPRAGNQGAMAAEVPGYDAAAVLQVSPQTGPAAGDTAVRLSGGDVRLTTLVLFGSRRADGLVVHSDGTVTVRTPPGASGHVVDVTAVLRDGRQLVAPGAFRYR